MVVEPNVTDVQILSIAIMVLAVMASAMFNNVRIGDMSKRIDDMRHLLRAEMKGVEASMDKNHSEMLHKFADLDARLTRIEDRLVSR